MALTRAQLLMSNQSQGAVLAGQPVAVTAGSGITIDPNTGVISVNAATITGVMKLNNGSAYNAYQWPNGPGTNGQFLQTNGAGLVDWADVQGFAVVSVQSGAPSPADIGELWFDCDTGTLNVYQNCVGTPSPNWFNVAQPGFPVDPANTSSDVAWTGSGTQASPYQMTVTTTGSGSAVQILNTVTITGLAPFQYVPIVDLNAVANGGRFSFTNYYADGGGQLVFNTVFTDLPASLPGVTYNAAIKVGYGTVYIDAQVSVTAALALPAGTITGTPTVGTLVAYTPGVATGGSGGYTYTYEWFRDGVSIAAPSASPAYTPVALDAGKILSVKQVVTDSSLATANATTTASAATGYAPIPPGTWNPGNAMNNSVPGTSSANWGGPTGTVTSDGCVVLSLNGTSWSQSVTATNGQPLFVQWNMAAAGTCGLAASGTTIQGKVTSAVGQNSYLVAVNRKPAPALPNVSDSNVALGATVSKSLGATVQGINTTAYITLGAASTGTNVRVSLDGGTTFVTVPSAPSTSMPVTLGQTIIIEQTVGTAVNTSPGYTAIINVGDSTGSAGAAATFQTVTYTATTVSSAVFPGVTFTPTGGPNAAPESVTGVAGGGTLGTLEGFAPSNAWPAAYATTLSSPVSGANPTMKMRVGASPYATSGVAVAASNVVDIAWNEAYLATVADGSAANGSITGTVSGTPYTNTFTMTVKRSAGWTVTPDPGNAATGTQQTTNPLTVDNFNVPVTVSFAAPSTGTVMTNIVAIVGGVSTTINPITTTVTLNPGETFEVLGDTGGTGGDTYGVKITIGSSPAQDWLVTTSSVPNAIQAPVMSPTGGPLNPAANSPAGITLGGGTYTPSSGSPGPHTSSDWQLIQGTATPIVSTNQITGTGAGPAPSWSSKNPSFSGASPIVQALAYGNGVYVAAGTNTSLSSSSDGNTWTARTSTYSSGETFYGATYGNGLFVVVSNGVNQAITSPDGTNWTQRNIGFGAVFARGVIFANNLFVAVGDGGNLSTSSNGTSWTPRTSSFGADNINAITYSSDKGLYVAVGDNGKIATSPDAITWTQRTSGTTNNLRAVTYGNGVFVSGGQSSTLLSSSDGITWTSRSGGSMGIFIGGFYGGGFLVMVGFNGYTTSLDGVTWTTISNSANNPLNTGMYVNGTYYVGGTNAIQTTTAPAPSTVITISAADTDGFAVGNLISNGVTGASAASGTITSINATTVTVAPQSANWAGGQNLYRGQTIVNVANSSDLVTYLVAQSLLATSTTYYSRARYSASSTSTVSPWANWASFSTAANFVPNPGVAMGGGYFAGQILVSSTLYNLIVAPIRGDVTGPNPSGILYGQYGGTSASQLAWKSTATGPDGGASQNQEYGKPWTDAAGAIGAPTYPVFGWCINDSTGPNAGSSVAGTGIGGFNDWYVPAKNELAILYFFLKRSANANSTSSGSNPNSVAPYTPNTTYGPSFPNLTTADGTGGTGNFLDANVQGFQNNVYATSTEDSGSTGKAWGQDMTDGNQFSGNKNFLFSIRAIRRILA